VVFGGLARWRGSADHDLMIEERPAQAGILAELLGEGISSVAIDTGGALHLGAGTHELEIFVDEDFEAWEITGPGTRRLICMPGGQIAEWN
jgi:hypothetical protein